MSYQAVKNSRHNLKRRLIYIMGSKCQICGYNKCQSALEFHHINPDQKDFHLGSNTNISFNKAKEEVKKCILVCSNCHREIHEGLINNLNSSYDEKRAKEIQQELDNFKNKTIHYCKNCGKIISSKAIFCLECSANNARVVERPSKQILKEKIRNTPFTQIGAEYQVSDNTIRKWCDAYHLPRTKKEINSYSDEEWNQI